MDIEFRELGAIGSFRQCPDRGPVSHNSEVAHVAGTKREVCRVVVQNREPALSEDVDEGKESLDQWQRSCERICLDLTVSPCLLTWSKAMLLQRPPPRTRYRRVFGSGSKLYQRFAVRGRFRHHSSDHVWLYSGYPCLARGFEKGSGRDRSCCGFG